MIILKNKHKYTLQRLLQILLAPAYSVISFLIRKEDNIVITGSLNKEFSDNARSLFELLIKDAKFSKRIYFVINDNKKRHSLNSIYPGKFITNFKIKHIILVLRARYWFSSAMELPLTAFCQRKIRTVVHLGHGMLYKKVGLIETKQSWYKKSYYHLVNSSISFTIATSEFCSKHISSGFGIPIDQVILTPQPKTINVMRPAHLNNEMLSDRALTHVLYAPTWRPYGAVKLFPFRDFNLNALSKFLSKNNIHIWLRVHPRFEQDIRPDLLQCSNIHLFSANEYGEVNSYLSYFDALITDYSSIYFDYLILKRPVLFFDYDFDEYNKVVGVIDNYEEIKSAGTTSSLMQFKSQLLSIRNNSFDLSSIERVNKIVNYPVCNSQIEHVVLKKITKILNDY